MEKLETDSLQSKTEVEVELSAFEAYRVRRERIRVEYESGIRPKLQGTSEEPLKQETSQEATSE